MVNRDIIVIGGSAGATVPLKQILGHLPADLPAAVFVVLHVPAQSVGILSGIAGAARRLPVVQARSGTAIERGHIYLAVPDHHLLIHDSRIVLGRGPRENLSRPAIDPLFSSAALQYGPRVIGVVLSGRLSDGAAGLNAIKRCGGIALVQDPADAIADEMPLRAMEATTVDLCVAGGKIGDMLSDLAREAPGAALTVPPDVRLKVGIAAGDRVESTRLAGFANSEPRICPSCGSLLPTIDAAQPPRFRCQLGYASAPAVLARQQESRFEEALRVALRIIEERAELVRHMSEDGRQSGRVAVARMCEARAIEYREYADVIRRAMLQTLVPPRV